MKFRFLVDGTEKSLPEQWGNYAIYQHVLVGRPHSVAWYWTCQEIRDRFPPGEHTIAFRFGQIQSNALRIIVGEHGDIRLPDCRLSARRIAQLSVKAKATGEPVVGAAAWVEDACLDLYNECSRARLAPTTERGETWLPFLLKSGVPTPALLELHISDHERSETIAVQYTLGAKAEGRHFSVEVTNEDAPPPPPRLKSVPGSKPVEIEVNGYIGRVGVCSNTTGLVTWEVTVLGTQHYVESIEVGEVPQGTFLSAAATAVTAAPPPLKHCPVPAEKRANKGFIIYAFRPFNEHVENIYVSEEPYCVADNGAAITCPD